MNRPIVSLCLFLVVAGLAFGQTFEVGFAKRDITPQAAVPMWGYGDRHADLSEGTTDPLLAKVTVTVTQFHCHLPHPFEPGFAIYNLCRFNTAKLRNSYDNLIHRQVSL